MERETSNNQSDCTSERRRHFLETCGRFALATPPAVTAILAGGIGPAWASGKRPRKPRKNDRGPG